ncbi:MAG: aspartate/glutamate racemase family protein [Rubrivivax sp.]
MRTTAASPAAARLGILVLDTAFERLPGDAGHPGTWPWPVQYRVLRGVTPADAIGPGAGALLDTVAEAALALAAEGVELVTTTCGFLVLLQRELAARCPVPVVSSSLLQIPWLHNVLPATQAVGILAADAAALSALHLRAAGVASDAARRVRIAGFDPASDFIRHMREQSKHADVRRQRDEVLALAEDLVRRHPDIGAIVCECANLPRYSAPIRERTGRPVFDLRTLVMWHLSGLRPMRFAPGDATKPRTESFR